MPIIRVTIPRLVKRLLYVTLAVSWLTGVAFFIFNQWIVVDGEFGPTKHPLQFWWLTFHGLAAFVFMMLFGAIAINHSLSSWGISRQRRSGLILFVALSLLIVTAYLLYYLANPMLRNIIAYVHLITGVLLPGLMLQHLAAAIKHRRQQTERRQQNSSAALTSVSKKLEPAGVSET
jgi:membrane-bound ClpP family serine protease